MKTYLWRHNYTSTFSSHEKLIRGKLAFKTKETHWLKTEKPIIVLLSVDSIFHDGFEGDLKMHAYMSTIKQHVQGEITVLLTEKAHLQTLSLEYQNDIVKAYETCLRKAQGLELRYQSYFKSCKVAYCHSYICQEKYFADFLTKIRELYGTDLHFQELIYKDAESTYTDKRKEKFPNKTLFIERAVEDLIEQCASLLVIAQKGYRFQFYTGNAFASTEYINRTLLSEENQISWISVFLTIEKKTIIYQD